MFSQLRHAVESIAPPRSSTDASEESGANPTSPTQLAESALSNLRKSLASQRPNAAPTKSPPPFGARSKLNLEERLRASFAHHESNGPQTQDDLVKSNSSLPPLQLEANTTVSPECIPLPDSPPLRSSSPPGSVPNIDTPEMSPGFLVDKPLSPEASASTNTPPAAQSDGSLNDLEHAQDSDSQATSLDTNQHPPVVEVSTPPVSTILTPPIVHKEERSDVEQLQERLKQVEQRFSEVSGSLRRLQAEKLAADAVLQELTSVHSVVDAEGLRHYLQSISASIEAGKLDSQNLRTELASQLERVEELQAIHKTELISNSHHVEQLKRQLSETESLLRASQELSDQAAGSTENDKAEITRLEKDIESLRTMAKEEEEKRTKAVSLLKTVRQKLVKTEKEKEDALKEILSLKERDRIDKEREDAERVRLQHLLEATNAEAEKVVASTKAQHGRELSESRERHEKEIATLKAHFEQEAMKLKSDHAEELNMRAARISLLENSLTNLASDKDNLFDQLQLRQAELESAQSHLESLESQNVELQYQLRECKDKISLLQEDILEVHRQSALQTRDPTAVANDVARMVATTEAKYEAKITTMKRDVATIEKERNESEAEWNKKLRQKSKELEEANNALASIVKAHQEHEEIVKGLQAQIRGLEDSAQVMQQQIQTLQLENGRLEEQIRVAATHEQQLKTKIGDVEAQIEEHKSRESQLRANNKSLKDELRKVQSSAAILERQRTPTSGYWTSRHSESTPDVRTPTASTSGQPDTPTTPQKEEEINVEYLRNVILQFLEHKEMRPNLVRVLSVLLRFTPQETRRLMAKV